MCESAADIANSVFRSYVFSLPGSVESDRSHRRAGDAGDVERNRVTGVQFSQNGQIHRVGAGSEWCSRWARIHTRRC